MNERRLLNNVRQPLLYQCAGKLFCIKVWGREILTIVHFLCRIASLTTRDRLAVDPRETHEKIWVGQRGRNLNNRTVFARSVCGVALCVELCRPFGACVERVCLFVGLHPPLGYVAPSGLTLRVAESSYVGLHPTLFLCRPFGACASQRT